MPTIDIIIRNKTASAVNPPCIVCGNSDYNVKFNFDDEWQAHNNKIGVFAYNRCGEWQSEKVLFEGDTCPVPALHGVRSVWIGVTAGDVRTSTPADVPCRMGATDFSDTTEKPSADIWGQILDKLDTVGTVQRINTVISYDIDRGDYVSSVDFATLLAAAQQPEKYIVTAARREGGEIVMPDPNATNTTYMKARFNSDGTITLIPLADETKSYTTECTANRVTAITAESTDTQYPTAKAVYDAIQAAIANLSNT